MKKEVLFIGFLLSGAIGMAAEVNDNFDRVDTAYSADGAAIGDKWVNASPLGEWRINEGKLFLNTKALPVNAILHHNGQKTVSGGGAAFTLKADVSPGLKNGYAGVAFNIQDPSNYYLLRIKGETGTYQLIRLVDGQNDVVMVNKTESSATFAPGSFYTITVTSEAPGSFEFTITEAGGTKNLNATKKAKDSKDPFTAGTAGLYCPTFNPVDPDASFDNFSLTVTE